MEDMTEYGSELVSEYAGPIRPLNVIALEDMTEYGSEPVSEYSGPILPPNVIIPGLPFPLPGVPVPLPDIPSIPIPSIPTSVDDATAALEEIFGNRDICLTTEQLASIFSTSAVADIIGTISSLPLNIVSNTSVSLIVWSPIGEIARNTLNISLSPEAITVDDVIAAVAGTAGSIGVTSLPELLASPQLSEVTGVAVGPDCTLPTIQSIADSAYSLATPVFVTISQAAAESNLAVSGFVSLLVEAAQSGRLIGFSAASEDIATQLQTFLASIDSVPTNTEDILIAGAGLAESTLVGLQEGLAGDAKINFEATATDSEALAQLCKGAADLIVSTTGFTSNEINAACNADVSALVLDIGSTGLVIVSNA